MAGHPGWERGRPGESDGHDGRWGYRWHEDRADQGRRDLARRYDIGVVHRSDLGCDFRPANIHHNADNKQQPDAAE